MRLHGLKSIFNVRKNFFLFTSSALCLFFLLSSPAHAQKISFNEDQLREKISSILDQTEMDLSDIPDQAEALYEFKSLQALAVDYLIEGLQSGDLDDSIAVQKNIGLQRGQDSLVALYLELFKKRGEKIPFVMGQYEEVLNTINTRYSKTSPRAIRKWENDLKDGIKDSVFRWQTRTLALMAAGYTTGESVEAWIETNKDTMPPFDRTVLFGKTITSETARSLLKPTDTAPTTKTEDGALIINPLYRRWNDISGKTLPDGEDAQPWRQRNFDFRSARSTLGLLVDELKKVDPQLEDNDSLATLVAMDFTWPESIATAGLLKQKSIVKMLMRSPPKEESDIRAAVNAVTQVRISKDEAQDIFNRLTSQFRYTLRKRRAEIKYTARYNKVTEIFAERIAYANETEPFDDERSALFLELMERLQKDFDILASLPEDPNKIDQRVAEQALYDLVRKTEDGELARHREVFIKTAEAYAKALGLTLDQFISDHLLDWHTKATVKLSATNLQVSDALNAIGPHGVGALVALRLRGFSEQFDNGQFYWSRWISHDGSGTVFAPEQIEKITTPVIGANRVARQKEVFDAFQAAQEEEKRSGRVPDAELDRSEYQPDHNYLRFQDEAEYTQSADEIIETIEGIISTRLLSNEYYNSKEIERPQFFLTAHLFKLTTEAFENEYLSPNVRMAKADDYFAKSVFLYVLQLYQNRDPLLRAQLEGWIRKAEEAEKRLKKRELNAAEKEDIRDALENFQIQFLAYEAAGYTKAWARGLWKIPNLDSDRIENRWKIFPLRMLHPQQSSRPVSRANTENTKASHAEPDVGTANSPPSQTAEQRPKPQDECVIVIGRIGRDSFKRDPSPDDEPKDPKRSWRGDTSREFPHLRAIN